jgi:hypothetical protein
VAQYNRGQYRDVFALTAVSTNLLASSPERKSPNIFASMKKAILEKAGLRQSSDKS